MTERPFTDLLPPAYKISVTQLQCTGCGAETHATCNCGKPYLPKLQHAAEAVAAHPEKSNRAIASDIGVDEKTVRQARASTADYSAVDEPRTGRDGKTRRLPSYIPAADDSDPNADTDLIDQIVDHFMKLSRDGKDRCVIRLDEIMRMPR